MYTKVVKTAYFVQETFLDIDCVGDDRTRNKPPPPFPDDLTPFMGVTRVPVVNDR